MLVFARTAATGQITPTQWVGEGFYKVPVLTGFEVAPGGRHLDALESGYDGGYGTGVVQPMQRH